MSLHPGLSQDHPFGIFLQHRLVRQNCPFGTGTLPNSKAKTTLQSNGGARGGTVSVDLERLVVELGRRADPDDSSESAMNRAEMFQSLAVALRASLPAKDCHRLAMLLEAPDDLPTDRRG